MNKIKILGFILISLALISACKGLKIDDIIDDEPTITLLVSHYKVECSSAFKNDLCLQIKTKGSSNAWEEYAADIKNFTYKWGFDYEIEVSYEDISPKPTDAPAREYTLVKKISETKTLNTSLFVLTVSRDTTADAIKKSASDNTIYKIYNEIDIKCDPVAECTTIEDNITQDNAIKFIFSHDASISNRLNISSIPCASARSSFETDCK